jgi:hypothetical protein
VVGTAQVRLCPPYARLLHWTGISLNQRFRDIAPRFFARLPRY